MNLAVIGTVFVDIKGYPLGSFNPRGRNAGRVQNFHGGVARNIAEDVANMGVDVMMVGLVDEGGAGLDVINHLKSRGVDTSYMRASEDGMGTWLAIFDEAGEVYASISKRTNLLPLCDVLDEDGDEIYGKADAILIEIDIDEEIVARAFELAAKHNRKVYSVISNITVAKERMDYILQSDCFICNRLEAAEFFEVAPEQFGNPEIALETLKANFAELGIDKMVVTLDSEGSVFADSTGDFGYVPTSQVKVVDTTGAGDSFFAGVSIGLSRGEGLRQACEVGTMMAANVIQSVGNVYHR